MTDFQGPFNIKLAKGSTERVTISRSESNRSAILRFVEGNPIIQMDDTSNGVYIRGNNHSEAATDAGSLTFGRVDNVQATNPDYLPRMHISGKGDVGIGTFKPQARLDVEKAGDNQWGMLIKSTGGSAYGLKIDTAWYDHEEIELFHAGARDNDGNEVPRFSIRANGNAYFFGNNGQKTIHIDGRHGDIILLGADCAEEFEVEEYQSLEPGTVMVIGDEDKLYECSEAYNKKVAGVISGAGSYRPGIILGRREINQVGVPLALSGKVFCKVDALYSPVEVGDLLTTSPTPGHAMKANDPMKAFGAVIGKALRPFTGGKGLIPILVALQ